MRSEDDSPPPNIPQCSGTDARARDLNVDAAVCFDTREGPLAAKNESPVFPVVRLPRAARVRCNQPPTPQPAEVRNLALTREQGTTEK